MSSFASMAELSAFVRHLNDIVIKLWLTTLSSIMLVIGCHDRSTPPTHGDADALFDGRPDTEADDQRIPMSSLEFLEQFTAGATSDDELPMIVALHGCGGSPEQIGRFFTRFDVKTRVILPRGPVELKRGSYAWLRTPDESIRLYRELLEITEEVATLSTSLARSRMTKGRPIIWGFSQGGVIAYTLAAHHPATIRGAIPVAGFLHPVLYPLNDVEGERPLVRGFHGEDDPITFSIHSRRSAVKLRMLGFDANVRVYEKVGHSWSMRMQRDIYQTLRAMIGDELALLPEPCRQCTGESVDPDSCQYCRRRE